MRFFPRRIAVLAALGITFTAAPGTSQVIRPPADSARPADTTRTMVIRAEDIPSRSDEAASRLRDLDGLLTADPAVTRAMAAGATLADSLPAILQAQQAVHARVMTRRALLDYTLEWQRRSGAVQGWRSTLRGRVASLQAGRDELAGMARSWTAAITAAQRDSAGPQVVALAGETSRQIEDLDRRMKARLDQLLAAEVQLSDIQLQIQRQDEQLARQSEQLRRELFRIDSPPIWRFLATLSPASLAGNLGSLWQENASALVAFAGTYVWRLLAHLVLTLLLIQFFRRGRTRLAAHPDDPLHGEPASVILQRPEAAALLLAVMAILWFYPRAPLIVYDVALLASVAPLMRLRQVLLRPHLQRAGLLTGLFMAAQRLVSIAGSGTELERLGALALSVAGGWMLVEGLRPGGPLRADGQGGWLALIELVAKVVLAGFGLSLVANLVGNASLATVTVSTLLILAYQAMVLVAAARVLAIALSEAVRVGSRYSRFLQRYAGSITARGKWLLNAAAVLSWGWLALFSYYLSEDVSTVVGQVLRTSWSLGEVQLSLGTILLFVAVLWIGTMAARFISLVLELDVLGRLSLDRGIPVTVGSLVRYALIAIAFLTALAATGVRITQLAIIGGALGVGIGFGLQNIVANFIAGLILAFERPVSLGDTVQLGDMTGEIRQIGIRASIIRTFDGAEVIVPNGELITREVTNWTRSDRLRRIEVTVGVAYGTDPKRVLPLLLEAARTHPEVAALPPPDARFMGFGNSSLDFSLRFWGDFARWTLIQSGVALAVHEAITAAGITIPFPQRDLHLMSASPDVVRQLAPSRGHGPAAD